jgi:hypothetical protein
MALSDQLNALATRAKEAEDRVAAAKQKAKADVEQEAKAAHQSAQEQADALRAKTAATKDEASAGRDRVQKSWNDHVAAARKNFDDRKAAHDLKSAQRSADRASEDAEWSIDYAYSGVVDAESAVLDAIVAQMDVDELAKA